MERKEVLENRKDVLRDADVMVYLNGEKIDIYSGDIAMKYYGLFYLDRIKEEPFGYSVYLSQPEIVWLEQQDMDCVGYTNIADCNYPENLCGFVTVYLGDSMATRNVYAEVGVVRYGEGFSIDFMGQGIDNEAFVGYGTRYRHFPVEIPEEVRNRALTVVREYIKANKEEIFGKEVSNGTER